MPTGLSATAVSTSQINLVWSASTDAVGVAGYKVYRDGAQISTIATSTTSAVITYTNTDLQEATAYTYTAAAYDAAGNTSAQSASASATTQSTPIPSSLGVPTNLSGVNKNNWSTELSWSDPSSVTGITNYVIYRSNTVGSLVSLPVTTHTFSDVNITGSSAYTYYVKSYDGQQYSEPSNSVTVTNSFTPVACASGSNNASLQYNTPGYVTTVDGNTYTDTCVDRATIGQGVNMKKAYCDGNSADPISSRNFAISVIYCADGCNAGACNPPPVSVTTQTSSLASVIAALKSLGALLQSLVK